ncbi:unnamed protein product [Blepharisma stoltei]|uniref:Uncharacterized protein n=1 Tax=Blepharisma stoltei TaxID=1481888 RepID=A0AAU9JP11_9CILI|nr:unnamed protein product [Blepharisma stoltei]
MTLGLDSEKEFQVIKFAGAASFFVGLVLISIKADDWTDADWIMVAIPILLSLCLLPIGIHCYFNINCPRGKSRRFILIISYNISLSLLVFGIIGSLTLDDTLDTSWAVAFIAIWYTLLMYLIFCCFMLPGLIDPEVNMRRQAFLLFVWFFGLGTFLLLFVFHLDEDSPDSFAIVTIPIMIASGLHIISCAIARFRADKKSNTGLRPIANELIFNSALLLTGLLLILRVTVSDWMPAIVIAVPTLALLLYGMSVEFYEKPNLGPEYEALAVEDNN